MSIQLLYLAPKHCMHAADGFPRRKVPGWEIKVLRGYEKPQMKIGCSQPKTAINLFAAQKSLVSHALFLFEGLRQCGKTDEGKKIAGFERPRRKEGLIVG